MWGASAGCASTRAPLWRTRAAPEPMWSRSTYYPAVAVLTYADGAAQIRDTSFVYAEGKGRYRWRMQDLDSTPSVS